MQPKLITLASGESGDRLSPAGAIKKANDLGLVLISNKLLDSRLVRTNRRREETQLSAVHTGTLITHDKPGKKLGSTIEWVDRTKNVKYTFEVPAAARGEKDVALVVDHGFTESGDPIIEVEHTAKKHFVIHITDPTKIGIVEGFPQRIGWYKPDEMFGIPVGTKFNFLRGLSDKGLRKLNTRFPVTIALVTRYRDDLGLDRSIMRSVEISPQFIRHGALAIESEQTKSGRERGK